MHWRKVNLWARRIVTRLINTVPTTIAILSGVEPLQMLVFSQVALSLMLPLPLLPLWKFTKDRKLMGEFVNRRITTIVSGTFVAFILALNVVLLYLSFGGKI
jgi:manganese transport protein